MATTQPAQTKAQLEDIDTNLQQAELSRLNLAPDQRAAIEAAMMQMLDERAPLQQAVASPGRK